MILGLHSPFNQRKSLLQKSFAEEHVDLRDYLGEGIFLLKNGDLGAIYSMEGVYDHPLDAEGLRSYFQKIYFAIRMMTSIPTHEDRKNIVYQVICSQRICEQNSHGTEPMIFNDKTQRACHDILKNEEDFYFRRELVKRTIYLCVRFQVADGNTEGILSKLKKMIKTSIDGGDLEIIFSNFQDFKKELGNFEDHLDWQGLRRLEAKEVISYYQEVLNCLESAPVISNDKNIHESIFTQVINNKNDHLEIGEDRKIFLYSFRGIPLDGTKLGNLSGFLQEIPAKNWDYCWVMSSVEKQYSKELVSQEYLFGDNQIISSNFESFKEKVGFNHPYGDQSLRLLIYSETKGLGSKIQAKAQEILGALVSKEDQILVHMIKTSLPLNCTAAENQLIGRTKKIRLQNSLCFFPLYMGPSDKEIYKKVSSFDSFTSFNLFAGEGNKMTSVLGMSRAGKGVLLSLFYMEFLGRFCNGVIRIIDKKTSSLKLAELIGGRVYRLSEDELRKNGYSPFAMSDWDDLDLSSIKTILLTTILQKNAQCLIEGIHDALLENALKYSYNNFQKTKAMGGAESSPHLTWEDILMSLPVVENHMIEGGMNAIAVQKAKEDLVKWSLSFRTSGQYGFIFSAYEKVNEENEQDRFIVYDLDGIADPILQQIAFMMSFQRISRDLRKLPLSVKKLIVFEELGMLLQSGNKQVQEIINIYMKDVVKTCAKLNAQAIGITNDVDDYAQKEAGRTFWDNSTQKIFLPMTKAMKERAFQQWEKEFNQAEWQILSYIHKNRIEKYSMAYINSQNEMAPYQAMIKIPLSPFMDALTTTSGSQTQLYSELKNQGHTPQAAINKMAQEYPYGNNLQ